MYQHQEVQKEKFDIGGSVYLLKDFSRTLVAI